MSHSAFAIGIAHTNPYAYSQSWPYPYPRAHGYHNFIPTMQQRWRHGGAILAPSPLLPTPRTEARKPMSRVGCA